jgi:hypothetical protein
VVAAPPRIDTIPDPVVPNINEYLQLSNIALSPLPD